MITQEKEIASMKNLKILFTLILLLCSISVAQAKTTKNKIDNRIEYINLDWWAKYNDPILTEYISTAFENNQDLKIATLNVKQADQVVKMAFANQLPHAGFQGDVFRDFSSSTVRFGGVTIPDYSQSNFFLPATLSYEADIWGENYLKTKSVKKQLEMVKQNERASYIYLTSSLAANYFNLVKLDKLIKNQEELVKIQTEVVKLQDKKYKNGLCTVMDLMNEKQLLTQLQEELNTYIDSRIVIGREVGVLTGLREKDLSEVKRGTYENIAIIPLPSGINAEVIQYRPDYLKAEDYVQKIGIDVKVARRDFLPKFQVYGQVGFNAFDWCRMFAPHTFLSNVGVAPSLDLFTGGLKKARLKYSKLEYEKALQIYEKSILNSIQELNDSLMSYRTSELNHKKSLERYELEQAKLDLANQKYSTGAQSKLENLKYNQKLLLEEADVIMNNINQEIAVINIYKATGGVDFTENL